MEKISFKKLTQPYENEFIDSLKECVKISSVYDEKSASETAPYGTNVSLALEWMRNLALKHGFKAEIVGSRCVEITYGDKGKEVGIFGHLDVVPLGEGWKHDPLGCEIENGYIYGRGVADDKGPVLAAFYALLALKENGLLNNQRVRFVCGGDEERGSSCLDYYFNEAKKKPVDIGFTPDSDFPLIYAEKGILNYTLKGNVDLGNDILAINAGVASNVVIDKARVTLKNSEHFVNYLKNNNVEFTVKDNVVTFIGKSAHGSTPELGINAGIIMLKYLGGFYNIEVLKILAAEYKDYNGHGLHEFFEKPCLGKTTYNVGLINYDGHTFSMVVNFRFPEDIDGKKIVEEIQTISPLPIYNGEPSKVLYFDKSSYIVKTLLNVYREETGDKVSEPLAIGGGTYAKEAANIVAFGATFPGKNNHMHESDENIELSDLYECLAIYAHAIIELGK
jgi:succinyl-diaminopimelate desuccinylase